MRIPGKWRTQQAFKTLRQRLGYDDRNWLRIRQIECWQNFLAEKQPIRDVLEISPGWEGVWKHTRCYSYNTMDYPSFDICNDVLPRKFHIIIADQVLEHVFDPVSAVRNIRQMLEPDGIALIATPFLFRVHARPYDYYRWTEAGLKRLCIDGGFKDESIKTDSWGNPKCVRAHTNGPVRAFGFGKDLSNHPEYPVMVWAIAHNYQDPDPLK